MKNEIYDVIIVGASIAGLECARNLAGSGLSVLIIEKSQTIGKKVCAGGVTLEDLKYIPRDFLNFDFRRILFRYQNKSVWFPSQAGLLSTINREKFLQHQFNSLKSYSNIKALLGVSVVKTGSDHCLTLNNGGQIKFRYLVGADGSASVVRRDLNLPTKRLGLAMQYLVPQKIKDFELYLDDNLFGTGYGWIFPHEDYTSIGCGSNVKAMPARKLRENLDLWSQRLGLFTSNSIFQVSPINYDYRGYKFGDVFLVGDAAGMTSGITGKGMYAAFLSGEQVAKEILGEKTQENLIEAWLKKKREQEGFISFLASAFLRKITFSVGMRLLPFSLTQQKILKLL
ncbi:MAG: NAD(P)/FAD-dependent oxidoreductase [Patescibacteria group bacterium]|nr:NAD(P)/FAD-dependent oxidoreductase [Patescibacteria group bacterium]